MIDDKIDNMIKSSLGLIYSFIKYGLTNLGTISVGTDAKDGKHYGVTVGTMYKCPNCGLYVFSSHTYCPECAIELEWDDE